MWDPSFPTRNLAHTPWTGRKSQSLNHQESPDVIFYTSVSFVSCYQSLSVNPAKENSGMECCTGVRTAPFCSQLSPSSVCDPGQDPPWPWHLACTSVRGGSGTSWLQQHISVPPSCGYRSSDFMERGGSSRSCCLWLSQGSSNLGTAPMLSAFCSEASLVGVPSRLSLLSSPFGDVTSHLPVLDGDGWMPNVCSEEAPSFPSARHLSPGSGVGCLWSDLWAARDVLPAAIDHPCCVSPSFLIPKGQRQCLLCQSWSLTDGGGELTM